MFNTVLSSRHDVVAVLTQPDRPAGRGLKKRPSAIKQAALQHGLAVIQPEQIERQEIECIAALQADLMITMSYGKVLPDELLANLPVGCVNIHTSLLPRWRGAAPIARAIEAGDTETGISLMRTVAELDAGPIITQHRCSITATDTAASLEQKLFTLGADAIGALLNYEDHLIRAFIAQAQHQSDEGISYAPKLKKQEAWIDWQHSAYKIACKIRAYNPWPIAQTYIGKQILRVLSARVCAYDLETARLKITKRNVYAGCGEGTLELLEVQPPGGKPMTATAYANGHRIADTMLR